jgi:FeS assembly SUF system regulator
MLRLSKLTDYAVVVLLRLGTESRAGAVQTSTGLSLATGVPEPTVAKVLKALSATGLVVSTRGARGGYRLAQPLGAVSIADVIASIDGPIALTACVDGSASTCDMSDVCAVRGRWDLVNDAIQQALSSITLAEMREASVPRAFRAVSALAAPAE